jgi:hypothetical protein
MTEAANNLAVLPVAQQFIGADVFSTPASFEHSQRVAKVFAASELVPAHLRKNGVTDVLLAYAIAKRMGEDPVIVMQNIFFVSGRAGWKTEYMIGRANKSGVFKGRINWRSQGQGDTLAVTAFAKLADTGEEITATASMGMAKAEGWTRNAKYQTMPEHMLRWRSATMLIRLFAPEVMLGVSTREELEDIQTLAPGADGAYVVTPSPKDLDARLADEAEPDSGRAGDISPPDPTPEATREGTDSAATDEPLDPKACRTLIGTMDADAIALWVVRNEAKIQALAPSARNIVRAAIADRKTALGEPK